MQIWRLKWIIRVILLIVALASTAVVAVCWRADNDTVNISSIAGLGVSVIGFIFTIVTLIDTQKENLATQQKAAADIAESQRKVEEAVRQAQETTREAREQIRQMLDKVRHRTLEADCSALRTGLQRLRLAAGDKNWGFALHLADECPALAERLACADGLEADDQISIRTGADDVRLIGAFIRKNRLSDPNGSLQVAHDKVIATLLSVIERLSAKLFHAPTKGV